MSSLLQVRVGTLRMLGEVDIKRVGFFVGGRSPSIFDGVVKQKHIGRRESSRRLGIPVSVACRVPSMTWRGLETHEGYIDLVESVACIERTQTPNAAGPL